METPDKEAATTGGPEQERYHFIEFHSVACSSQNVGTSLEELSFSLRPTENGWECGRFVKFPQEIVFKLHSRTKLEYILVAAKKNLGFESMQVLVGDGLSGSFVDVTYHVAGEAKTVNAQQYKLKCYGIGSFLKLVFTKQPLQIPENPMDKLVSRSSVSGEPQLHTTRG